MVGQLVSVKGKLKIENKVRIIQSSYNSTESKISSNNVITEETATIKFTLWEHWIQLFQCKSSQCVKVFNAVVKHFDGKLNLSSCAEMFGTNGRCQSGTFTR